MKRIALLGLLALPLLAGCHGPTWVEAAYEIDPDAWVVVMPYKDPNYRSRWDSPTGHDLAVATTEILAANAEFYVRPYQDVVDLLAAETDVRDLTPRDVAALCRADYVLVCDLEEWDPLDNKGVGITQGAAAVRARVFEVVRSRSRERDDSDEAKVREQNQARRKAGLQEIAFERGGEFVHNAIVQARYPSSYASQYGESFMEPEVARAGLVAEAAKKVAQLYFAHDEGPTRLRAEYE